MFKCTDQTKDGSLSWSGMVKDHFNAVLLINKSINLALPNLPALRNHVQFDCRDQMQSGDGMRQQHKTNLKVSTGLEDTTILFEC